MGIFYISNGTLLKSQVKKFRAKVARDNHAALGPTPGGLATTATIFVYSDIENTAGLASPQS